jgi:hypothetical protein
MRHAGANRATTGDDSTKSLYTVARGNDNEWLCVCVGERRQDHVPRIRKVSLFENVSGIYFRVHRSA